MGAAVSFGVTTCLEGKRLLEVFGNAVHELTALRDERFAEVMNGNLRFERIDSLISLAVRKKQIAKDAYLLHADQHGCWVFTTAADHDGDSNASA